MSASDSGANEGIRYEPDERPPTAVSLGLGLQLVVLNITAIILIPAVVMRAAGAAEAYLSWAIFATVAVCGVTTMLQALRIGRIGSGHVLVVGTSAAFIAVSISAVSAGGPALLAILVVIAALVPIVLSGLLSLFQRILTPTVTGLIAMLIPVTVMPPIFGLLKDVPDESPTLAPPLSALVTIFIIVGIALKATGGAARLWGPLIGVVAGSAVAAFFGLYGMDRVAEAPWIGLPTMEWPGLALDFGPAFWGLLPAFLLVAAIGTIQAVSSAVAIQRVSWRRSRAVDFRAVQGAMTADGLGNLLAGLVGTVPNTALAVSVSVTALTGVSARSVGIAAGLVFIVLAFFPKALAVVVAIPGPVVAAYLAVLMAMLFVVGMRMVIQEGIDYRKSVIVGVAFWVGVGFQSSAIFPEHVSAFAGGFLRNGITAGGLTAILATLFMELTGPRRSRMEAALGLSVLPTIREFLGAFASRGGWGTAMADRLYAVGEETLLTLLRQDEGEEERPRRLRLAAYREGSGAVLEFVVSSREDNIQDRVALLGEGEDHAAVEREVSLRLLRHLASSVRHQQYHGRDIVTVRVSAPARGS